MSFDSFEMVSLKYCVSDMKLILGCFLYHDPRLFLIQIQIQIQW